MPWWPAAISSAPGEELAADVHEVGVGGEGGGVGGAVAGVPGALEALDDGLDDGLGIHLGSSRLDSHLTPVKTHLHLTCVKYAGANSRQRPGSDRGRPGRRCPRCPRSRARPASPGRRCTSTSPSGRRCCSRSSSTSTSARTFRPPSRRSGRSRWSRPGARVGLHAGAPQPAHRGGGARARRDSPRGRAGRPCVARPHREPHGRRHGDRAEAPPRGPRASELANRGGRGIALGAHLVPGVGRPGERGRAGAGALRGDRHERGARRARRARSP